MSSQLFEALDDEGGGQGGVRTLAEYWGVPSAADAIETMAADPASHAGKVVKAKAKRKPRWEPTIDKGRLLDPKLSTSAFATDNIKATQEANYGLYPNAGSSSSSAPRSNRAPNSSEIGATAERPVFPASSLTAAAARTLHRGENVVRSISTEPTLPGQALPRLIKCDDSVSSNATWKAVFSPHPGPAIKHKINAVVQDRGNFQIRTKRHGKGGGVNNNSNSNSRSFSSLGFSSSSPAPGDEVVEQEWSHLQGGGKQNSAVSLIRRDAESLIESGSWFELENRICSLKVVRSALWDSGGGAQAVQGLVMDLLDVFTKACSAGETAVKRDSRAREVEEQGDHGAPITNRPPSKDVIDSFVQYRRFVLELASRRVERQQYVLELALALRDVAPKVRADGTKVLQEAAKMVKEMLATFETLGNVRSPVSVKALAGLKSALREIHEEGSMSNSDVSSITAAMHRVLIAKVGERLVQTRELLMQRGIALEGWVLKEVLRMDPGVYHTNISLSVAKQAITDAESSLEALQQHLQVQQAARRAQRLKEAETAQLQRAEEEELERIMDGEKVKNASSKQHAGRNSLYMQRALTNAVWETTTFGGGGGGKGGGEDNTNNTGSANRTPSDVSSPGKSAVFDGGGGGAVVMHDDLVCVSSSDSVIKVFDLETVTYGLCKECFLQGHTGDVTSLCMFGKRHLVSGSLDTTIRVWDLKSMSCKAVLRGHRGAVSCVCTAEAGEGTGDRFIISGSFDTTVRVWRKKVVDDDEEEEEKESRGGEGGGEGEGGGDGKVEAGGWICSMVLRGHGCYVHTVAASGPFIYSGGEDGLLKMWHITTKHSIGQLEGSDDRPVYAICLDPQGGDGARGLLMSVGMAYDVNVWDLGSQAFQDYGIGSAADTVIKVLSPVEHVNRLREEVIQMRKTVENAITPEGRIVLEEALNDAIAASNKAAKKTLSFKYVKALSLHDGLVYTAGGENIMRVWSQDTGSSIGIIKEVGGHGGVHSTSINVSKNMMSVCGMDRRVRIYGTEKAKEDHDAGIRKREEDFLDHGGELWSYDLIGNQSRLLMPGVVVRNMSCGAEHALILDSNRVVWSWGSSARGQTGSGSRETVTNPTQIESLVGTTFSEGTRATAIAAGHYHSLMVSTKGEVWVWGDNDSCQCGTDASSDVQHYKDELEGLRAKLEAAQSGDKGGKGHDQHGIQLITESIAQVEQALAASNYIYTPRRNGYLKAKSVVGVSGGRAHSIFFDEAGIVYVCGDNKRGQLGIPLDSLAPDKVEGTLVRIPLAIGEPLRDPSDKGAPKVRIVAVSAGRDHSLCLSEEGRAFAFGAATDGQLGLSTSNAALDRDVFEPAQVESLKRTRLTGIAAGHSHSLFLSGDGAVWSTGKADNGALGLGNVKIAHSPKAVKRLLTDFELGGVRLNVREIGACGVSSLFVSSRCRAFYCGPRKHPNIQGQGAESAVKEPSQLKDTAPIGNVPIVKASRFLADNPVCTSSQVLIVVAPQCVGFRARIEIGSPASSRGQSPVQTNEPAPVPHASMFRSMPSFTSEAAGGVAADAGIQPKAVMFASMVPQGSSKMFDSADLRRIPSAGGVSGVDLVDIPESQASDSDPPQPKPLPNRRESLI